MPRPSSRKLRWGVVLGAGILLVAIALLALWPFGVSDPPSRHRPSSDLASVLARLEAIRAAEGAEIAPACRTTLLDHGHRTGRAFVFLHGFTNCPHQFLPLARAAHAAGHNVLLVRLPRHGYADRMTEALAGLTAEELAASADLAVDLGAGLGDSLTVVGLSVGALAVAWVAQHRPEVDHAILLAPNFGLPHLPDPLNEMVAKLLILAPNRFRWWDTEKREKLEGPVVCYPRFSSRALGESMKLGLAVRRDARRRHPSARSIWIVTNAADPAVSGASTASAVAAWRRLGAQVITYEFPAELELGHDFVDPDQPYEKTEFVYPKLESLLGLAPEGSAPAAGPGAP